MPRGKSPARDQPAADDPGVQRALAHLREQAVGLGLRAGSDFVPLRSRVRGERRFVRLRQTHAGIPVFAAQAVVQLDRDGRQAEFVLPDLARSPALDRVRTVPALSGAGAAGAAVAWARARRPGGEFEARTPSLEIFAPDVLDAAGEPRLVWVVEVGPRLDEPRGSEPPLVPAGAHRLLLDASDGSVVRVYPLEYHVIDRVVYDSENSNWEFKTLARGEGFPPSGIADVDQCFEQLGDMYLFYAFQYARDGIDGLGMESLADVRFCRNGCPYNNAFWTGWDDAMFFGPGWAVDDITGHEYTHGVTDYESNLVYENASGAINESISDIFGELMDQTNGHGVDGPSVRWLIGEELALATLRDMRNPPAFNQPDRLRSPLYFPAVANPDDTNDQGGVHTNSGVGNKLCSLLVDGGAFNGQVVTAMGIYPVAALFYEANTNLLTSGSGWAELYLALRQAAVNLGWSAADRANLDRACGAVEIPLLWVRGESACTTETGTFSCLPTHGPYHTLAGGVAAMPAGGSLRITAGNYTGQLLNKRGWYEAQSGVVRVSP